MSFKIKSFFIKENLTSDWENVTFSKENVIKETEKAVFLEHPTSKLKRWVPKSVLSKSRDLTDLHSIPSEVSLPNFCSEKPEEVKEILKRCESCGCANDGKCSMYNNLNIEYALLMCMKNDIEEKERENEFLRYQLQQQPQT